MEESKKKLEKLRLDCEEAEGKVEKVGKQETEESGEVEDEGEGKIKIWEFNGHQYQYMNFEVDTHCQYCGEYLLNREGFWCNSTLFFSFFFSFLFLSFLFLSFLFFCFPLTFLIFKYNLFLDQRVRLHLPQKMSYPTGGFLLGTNRNSNPRAFLLHGL